MFTTWTGFWHLGLMYFIGSMATGISDLNNKMFNIAPEKPLLWWDPKIYLLGLPLWWGSGKYGVDGKAFFMPDFTVISFFAISTGVFLLVFYGFCTGLASAPQLESTKKH